MQVFVFGVQRHLANVNLCPNMNGFTQTCSIGGKNAVHRKRQTRSEPAVLVQDVSSGALILLEVRIQNLPKRISEYLFRRAGNVMLNERRESNRRHRLPS